MRRAHTQATERVCITDLCKQATLRIILHEQHAVSMLFRSQGVKLARLVWSIRSFSLKGADVRFFCKLVG